MKSSSVRSNRQRLMMSYVPRRPDLPAIFESLNDDTLTTVLEFVGNKCYKSFGGLNYHSREIYISSGMTKKTFLFGYASLSVIQDIIIERAGCGLELYQRVGKGVVLYNRRDVFEWALQEQKTYVLAGICNVAAEEGRTDILEEVWNKVEDKYYKRSVFECVDDCAAHHGKLNVLNWYDTKGLYIVKDGCAKKAAWHGQLLIIQWLHEEKGYQLYGELYDCAISGAIQGGHMNVLEWLREQACPWSRWTFKSVAQKGNLDILQWLHNEGCRWPEDDRYRVREEDLKPEVVEWLRVNGYGNRIIGVM